MSTNALTSKFGFASFLYKKNEPWSIFIFFIFYLVDMFYG